MSKHVMVKPEPRRVGLTRAIVVYHDRLFESTGRKYRGRLLEDSKGLESKDKCGHHLTWTIKNGEGVIRQEPLLGLAEARLSQRPTNKAVDLTWSPDSAPTNLTTNNLITAATALITTTDQLINSKHYYDEVSFVK